MYIGKGCDDIIHSFMCFNAKHIFQEKKYFLKIYDIMEI